MNGAASAFGALLPIAMMLAGIVTILRARRAKRRGLDTTTPKEQSRQAAALEMERRMASYLAQRDSGN